MTHPDRSKSRRTQSPEIKSATTIVSHDSFRALTILSSRAKRGIFLLAVSSSRAKTKFPRSARDDNGMGCSIHHSFAGCRWIWKSWLPLHHQSRRDTLGRFAAGCQDGGGIYAARNARCCSKRKNAVPRSGRSQTGGPECGSDPGRQSSRREGYRSVETPAQSNLYRDAAA